MIPNAYVRIEVPSPLRFLVAAALAMAAACATAAEEDARLAPWVGHEANELIATWGPPTSSRSTERGETRLTWSTFREVTRRLPSKAIRNGSAHDAKTLESQTRRYWCDRTMTIGEAGRVLDGQWQGNDCASG